MEAGLITVVLSGLNVAGLSIGLAIVAVRKLKHRKNGGTCSEHSGMVAGLEALKSGQIKMQETLNMVVNKLIPGR